MYALEERKTLERADALFDTQVHKALELYGVLDPAMVAADQQRLTRILRQLHRQQEPALQSLLTHTLEHRSDRYRRGALNLLAREAWYAGDTQRAGTLWRSVVDEGRDERDPLWRTGVQNLALTYESHGRRLESFLLIGLGQREAAEAGDAHSLAYGTVRRGRALVELGELEIAERELLAAERLLPTLDDANLAWPVRATLTRGWARLQMARKDWDAAGDYLATSEGDLQDLGPSRQAVTVGAHTTQLHLEFERSPARRGAVLAAFAEVLAGPELDGHWRSECQAFATELELRHAIEDLGDLAQASEKARVLLELLPEIESGDELIRRMSWLGGVFADELAEPEAAREAIEVAAAECLKRVVQVSGLASDLPELVEASEEDLRVLEGQRARMRRGHALLFDRIAELWQPGNPAFDLVVEYGIVRVCAWCRRVSSRDGGWIPIAHFLPTSTAFAVTHGICQGCEARVSI